MSLLDYLNNDLLALIAQHLPIKELLYFIRTHRRLHALNSLNSSWCSRVFEYSHVAIQLSEGSFFHQWVMKFSKYVYSAENEISQSRLNRGYDKGLISLSTWQSIKHGLCYVLNRWFNEHGDKMKNLHCHSHMYTPREKFDIERAKRIIETRDNPPSTIIKLESGEQCEVLTELNENVLNNKISPELVPCYRSRLILLATPNLRALSFTIDAMWCLIPKFDDLLGLVPNLRSLTLCQWYSRESHTSVSLIPIRQTMKYLTKLESLTINSFILSIQDLIDISAHPRLTLIILDDAGADGEGMNQEEWKWFRRSYKFNSEQSENHSDKHNSRIKISQQEFADDDKNIKIIENASLKEFRVDGDRDEHPELSVHQLNHSFDYEWKPEQMSADIEYLQSSLLLPSSTASMKARLKLLNLLQSKLFRPHRSGWYRPLKYLRHLRHQIYLLHSSLTQSLNNTLNNPVDDVNNDNDENKRQRLN